MADVSLTRMTVAELAKLIQAKDVSPVAVAEAFIERTDATEPQLNAWITLLPDETRAAAKRAEVLLTSLGDAVDDQAHFDLALVRGTAHAQARRGDAAVEHLSRAAEIAAKRERDEPTVPTRLNRELATNPFLRADAPEMRDRWGGETPADTFAKLRAAKDSF